MGNMLFFDIIEAQRFAGTAKRCASIMSKKNIFPFFFFYFFTALEIIILFYLRYVWRLLCSLKASEHTAGAKSQPHDGHSLDPLIG